MKSIEKSSSPKLNKKVYAILTLLLGFIGINKIYAGKIKQGIVSFLFSWTLIPAILSIAEFIVVLTEKADKKGYIDLESKRREKVAFIIATVLFVAFMLLAIIPWESFFTGFTAFTKFNEILSSVVAGEYSLFNNIIGAPVITDTTYGSTSGVIPVLGTWDMADIAVILVILSAIIAAYNRIKVDSFIENAGEKIKKVLPVAVIAILVSLVLVITVTTGINITIVNKILGITKNFNVATTFLGGVVGSLLTADFYYYLATLSQLFTASAASSEYYSVAAYIMQSIYYVIMIIAPTSLGLVIGLYHFDIPYSKWLKFIWKAFLIILAIVVVASIILFAIA